MKIITFVIISTNPRPFQTPLRWDQKSIIWLSLIFLSLFVSLPLSPSLSLSLASTALSYDILSLSLSLSLSLAFSLRVKCPLLTYFLSCFDPLASYFLTITLAWPYFRHLFDLFFLDQTKNSILFETCN